MSEKIHSASQDCALSELDLFSVPPTSSQAERSAYVSYLPLASLDGNSPLEFSVVGSDEYIDLARCHLRLKVRITNAAGASITDADLVAPTNNFIHSLFSQTDIYLNERLVSGSHTLYPYRSYLETLLNYGSEASKSQLSCALWFPDTPGHFDTNTNANSGWHQRKTMAGSNSIELISWIHGDIFNQDKYLLNHVDLRIRMTRAKPEFCLMTSTDRTEFKVKIEEAVFYVRKVKLNNSVLVAHAQMLQNNSAKYPVRRVEMRSFALAPGITAITKDNLFSGQLPKRCIVGLVESAALNGNYAKNPFNFKHYTLNFLTLYVDSESFPSQALTPDFVNNQYLRSYQTLLESLDIWKADKGLPFGRASYSKGFTLYGFELSPEGKECNDYFNVIKSGNCRLELKFGAALPHAVSVIFYAEFENLLEIDQDRKVIFDYSA